MCHAHIAERYFLITQTDTGSNYALVSNSGLIDSGWWWTIGQMNVRFGRRLAAVVTLVWRKCYRKCEIFIVQNCNSLYHAKRHGFQGQLNNG